MTGPAPRSSPQQPPPKAPGSGELFEQALTAILDPSVFRRAAARPAPSFGAAGALALASGTAALAIVLAHALVSSPGLLQRFSPPILAAVGVAALGLYSSILLLLAVLLYAMGNGCGGKGGFERGLQAVAMLSVLVPVQMLCNWFPAAWVLPALLAGWVAACALEGLFGASAGASRSVCAVLAAGAIGLQFVGRVMADRARDAYAATQTTSDSADGAAQLAREVAAVQDRTQALTAAMSAPAASPAPTSGLDLLRGGPDGGGSPQDPSPNAPNAAAPGQPPAALAAQSMQANAAGMLDAVGPLIASIAASKNATPQQKADMKELAGLMHDLKGLLSSGKPLDNAVFSQKMSRYQQLLVKVMADSRPPAAGAPPSADPMPHLKLPQNQQ